MADLQLLSAEPERSSQYHAYPLSEGLVVLRVGTPQLFLLNSTARSFWELSAQGLGEKQIAARWEREYGLSRERAEAEVRSLGAALQRVGLLGPAAAAGSRVPRPLRPARCRCDAQAPLPRICANVTQTFSVQCSSPELERAVRWIYAHLESDRGSVRTRLEVVETSSGYAVNQDGHELAAVASLDQLLPTLLFCVGELGRHDPSQLLVLHAGAVASAGHCLLFPALSGGGKTTLVAYLSHHGFDYLADDMTPIDAATLQAEPAPTCMNLKSGSWEIVARFRPDLMQREPIQLASRRVRLLPPPPTDPLLWRRRYPVRAIICLRFAPSGQLALQALQPFELLQEIVESQAYFQQPLVPERVERLVEWVGKVPGYRLSYSSLEDAAKLLRTLV
jgi:hypothetical protein